MGCMVEVICAACGLSFEGINGIGMAGRGSALAACEVCGSLKELPITKDELPLHDVDCPDCGHAARLISPIADEPWTAKTPRSGGPCPRCHAELNLRVVGLWD